jgi:DNA-binding MarR family transcriptional regulator
MPRRNGGATDRGPKIWRQVLARISSKNPPEFTAGDVAKDFGMAYANAAQLLRRLQNWGHIRVLAFDPPAGGGAGRRRKVYEMTDHGKKVAKYHREQQS